MKTITLPKGTLLYHGSSEPRDFNSWRRTGFFSRTPLVAELFAIGEMVTPGKHREFKLPAVATYRLTRDVVLVSSRYDDFLDVLANMRIGIRGRYFPELADEFGKRNRLGVDGWFVPDMYQCTTDSGYRVGTKDAADVMLITPRNCVELVSVRELGTKNKGWMWKLKDRVSEPPPRKKKHIRANA